MYTARDFEKEHNLEPLCINTMYGSRETDYKGLYHHISSAIKEFEEDRIKRDVVSCYGSSDILFSYHPNSEWTISVIYDRGNNSFGIKFHLVNISGRFTVEITNGSNIATINFNPDAIYDYNFDMCKAIGLIYKEMRKKYADDFNFQKSADEISKILHYTFYSWHIENSLNV